MFTIIGIPCSSFSRKLNISTDLRLVILVMKHFCSYCFSAVFKCFIIDTIIIIIIIIIIISVVNYYLGVAQGWTVRITQPWGGGGAHSRYLKCPPSISLSKAAGLFIFLGGGWVGGEITAYDA